LGQVKVMAGKKTYCIGMSAVREMTKGCIGRSGTVGTNQKSATRWDGFRTSCENEIHKWQALQPNKNVGDV
jgi:hypothetical protein